MNIRKTIFLFTSLALFLTLLGGYFYFSASLKHATHLEHDKAVKYVIAIKNIFSSHIKDFQKESKLLADHKMVQEAFVINNSKTLFSANTTLDYFKRGLDADVCYLIDLHGNTIASSNRNTAKSFVGHNYGFREYFKEAIQGHPHMYLAIGATSGERGICFSQPVYGNNKKSVIGVAVIKRSMNFLHIENTNIEQSILVLIDPDGVIFISNRQDWLYKFLWKPSIVVLDKIKKKRQFGLDPWTWTGVVQKNQEYATDAEGNSYFLHSERIDNLPDWKLIYLQNVQDVSKAYYKVPFKVLSVIILILLIFSGALIIFLFKKANLELSKRKEVQDALLESEQRFRSLSEASFEGIVIHEEGVILQTNELLPTMFGYVPHELIGKNVLELAAPESRDDASRKIKLRWESPYELLGLKKDGSNFVAEVHGKTIPYKGQTKRVTTVRDITARKLVEEEREKLITDLQKALNEIKTLRGILPICASCKKIRDDKGYWNRIESYIQNRSQAEFSHAICPDCSKKLYPDYVDNNGNIIK